MEFYKNILHTGKTIDTLTAWKLVNEISDSLAKRFSNNLLAIAIETAIYKGVAPVEIISSMQDFINDNEELVMDVIGKDLTIKIKKA